MHRISYPKYLPFEFRIKLQARRYPSFLSIFIPSIPKNVKYFQERCILWPKRAEACWMTSLLRKTWCCLQQLSCLLQKSDRNALCKSFRTWPDRVLLIASLWIFEDSAPSPLLSSDRTAFCSSAWPRSMAKRYETWEVLCQVWDVEKLKMWSPVILVLNREMMQIIELE